MSLVTLSTLYQTIFISLLLLLSKGWFIARSSLSRQDISTITLMMGAIYLVYSAFYVSINIEGMKLFISVILNALYLILMIVVLKNTYDTRAILKGQQRVILDNNVENLEPAINLKVRIMTCFLWIAAAYFGFELVINGLIPSVELASKQTTGSTASNGSSNFNPWEEVVQQYYDLAIIGAILYVFRPRKWPEFFTVGLYDGDLDDVGETNSQLVEQYRVVPLYQTQIDKKLLHSGEGFDKKDHDLYDVDRSFTSDD